VKADPLEDIKARVRGTVIDNLELYLEAIRFYYDERSLPAKPYLMFKSIEVADLPRYRGLFPDMKFVHIVRHPYSNYTSLKRTDMVLKQKPFWFQGGDILRLQLESRWIPHVRFALEGIESDPAHHHLVRYEDLCKSPEQVVAGICHWLGVDGPKEPALQTVLGGKHLKTLPINSSLKGVETPAHVVADMAQSYGYDEVLTERERGLILLRTYELGRRLGYFSPEVRAHLPSRLHLFSQWMPPDEWEYKNADSKARLVSALIQRRLYLCRKLLLPIT
jgi:Sulfotransferase family